MLLKLMSEIPRQDHFVLAHKVRPPRLQVKPTLAFEIGLGITITIREIYDVE